MANYVNKEMTADNRSEIFKDLYADWAATIEGLTPSDKQLWVDFVQEQGGLTEDAEIVSYTGKDMNEFFQLTGDNAYPDDCHMYSVCCKHIANADKLALPMRQIGMRWFTDIVDNNARREGNESYVESVLD